MSTQCLPIRVLVVEDDPLMCWSLSETLTNSGAVVIQAGSGAGALCAISNVREPVDVVLLDYKLPDVHDLNLLSTVRRVWPASRVILMSAHATPEIATKALALGASRVMSKPVDMCDVPALVREVTSRNDESRFGGLSNRSSRATPWQ